VADDHTAAVLKPWRVKTGSTAVESKARWICSQIGARQHYAVPIGLYRDGLLDQMFTDIWAPPLLSRSRIGTRRLRALAGRYDGEVPKEKVRSFTVRALGREAYFRVRRSLCRSADVFGHYTDYGRWFAQAVSQRLRLQFLNPETHLFHGFTTGALETLQLLRDREIPCVLQQIDAGRAHYDVVGQEMKRWPGWQTNLQKLPERYFYRIEQEWERASLVIVNSKYVSGALVSQGVPLEKIVVFPLLYEMPSRVNVHRQCFKDPLRVLWVADVLLGKGIQYLIGAARRLAHRQITFHVLGSIGISRAAVSGAPDNVQFLGRIPRSQVHGFYEQSHLYVLPTLSDGFALTQLEAMAHGLPVVTTPNCGEVVTNGIDGFIIPARDEVALAEAIARLDDDRELLASMQAKTNEKLQAFSLEGYGKRLTELVSPIIGRNRVHHPITPDAS
jgi:glycosyltransferase involved in cell wall biosynthesis